LSVFRFPLRKEIENGKVSTLYTLGSNPVTALTLVAKWHHEFGAENRSKATQYPPRQASSFEK
jgi:hypothetical protein